MICQIHVRAVYRGSHSNLPCALNDLAKRFCYTEAFACQKKSLAETKFCSLHKYTESQKKRYKVEILKLFYSKHETLTFVVTELEIKDTAESNTSASYLDLLLSIGRDGQLRTSLYDKHDDFNFHITNFPFLSSKLATSHLRPPMAFLSHNSSDTPGLAPLMNVLF